MPDDVIRNFENIKLLNPEDASVVAVATSRAVEEEVVADEELLEDTESAEPEVISKGKSDEESEG